MNRKWIRSPLRDSPLPTTKLEGQFRIAADTVWRIYEVLRRQSAHGPSDSGNEGLVFLAGNRTDRETVYSTVIVPAVRNTHSSVFVDAKEFGKCAKRARQDNLLILAQLHSHPGSCCHHSDGDDRLIMLPFEGMLSIVVPNYGEVDVPFENCGVHQLRDGVWHFCTEKSVRKHFKIIPSVIVVQ